MKQMTITAVLLVCGAGLAMAESSPAPSNPQAPAASTEIHRPSEGPPATDRIAGGPSVREQAGERRESGVSEDREELSRSGTSGDSDEDD